jgi:hypothetical protein
MATLKKDLFIKAKIKSMKELKQMNRQGVENIKIFNSNILKVNRMKKDFINSQHGLMKMSIETYRSTKSLITCKSKSDMLETRMSEFNDKVNRLAILKQKYDFLNT